jgi:hypothetical protein
MSADIDLDLADRERLLQLIQATPARQLQLKAKYADTTVVCMLQIFLMIL